MVVVCASEISIYATIKNAFRLNGNATVTTTVGITATSMQVQVAKVYKVEIRVLSSGCHSILVITYPEIIVRM